MSKCELTFVFDRPDRRFKLGETVKGRLGVSVDADCRCDALTLTRLWEAHGRGNRAQGNEETLTLFKGEWRAGESHSYPFELTIPPGPVSYRGHYLNVDYYLRARADIPWALDPKAEEDFIVELGDDVESFLPGAVEDLPPTLQGAAGSMGLPRYFLAMFGCVFMVPGLIVALVGTSMALSGDLEGWFMIPFGGIFVAVGAGAAYMGIRNTLAEKRLGPVLIQVEPRRLRPGQALALGVEFTPQGQAKINHVTAKLTGVESVVSGSGTNRTTHTHTLHTHELTLLEGATLFAGEAQHLADKATLPPDAPFTFSAPDNHLKWSVEFHIDVAGWPDWSQTVSLVVGP